MASFKETFKAERDKKGPGKTFTWTDKNGKTETYSTNYAEEEKKPSGTKPKAKPAPTKPKARPANLNPQSGAAQSGTAGKVKPKTKPSGFPDKFNDPDSGYRYEHLPGKGRNSSKAAPAMSGASRSTAGKVTPKMSQTERAMAEAKARREASQRANRGNNKTTTTTTVPTAAVKPLTKLMQILSQGGFSNYMKKK
jgi:hypothetical protein